MHKIKKQLALRQAKRNNFCRKTERETVVNYNIEFFASANNSKNFLEMKNKNFQNLKI